MLPVRSVFGDGGTGGLALGNADLTHGFAAVRLKVQVESPLTGGARSKAVQLVTLTLQTGSSLATRTTQSLLPVGNADTTHHFSAGNADDPEGLAVGNAGNTERSDGEQVYLKRSIKGGAGQPLFMLLT